MATPLANGDAMPAVLGKDADGNEVDIVASVAGSWAIGAILPWTLVTVLPSTVG